MGAVKTVSNQNMKLNKNTVDVLKNFSKINPNCLFRTGKVLSTVNESKSFIAEAEIEDSIEDEFGIYNLTEFLSAVSIIEDAEIAVNGKTLTITAENSAAKVKYGCADASILTIPPADGITMPAADVSFTITADILAQIVGSVGSLSLAKAGKAGKICVSGAGGDSKLTVTVEASDGSTRNTFVTDLTQGVSVNEDLESFVAEFPSDLFMMTRGDYEVQVSRGGITQWEHTSEPIRYWIATSKSSEFTSK